MAVPVRPIRPMRRSNVATVDTEARRWRGCVEHPMKFMTWRLWVGVARAALTAAAAAAMTAAGTGATAVHAAGPGVRHSFIE